MQVATYIELSRDTFSKIKKQSGVARIELQILLVGGSAAATAIIILMAIGVIFRTSISIHMQPLVVLMFYALTVTAITTHRIFDATYLLQLLLQRIALVCVVAGAAYGVDILFQLFLPEPFAYLITTAVILAFASELNSWLDKYSERYPKAVQARAAIIAAAKEYDQFTDLIKKFEAILSGWAQTEKVAISVKDELRWIDGENTPQIDEETYIALKEARWSTPERLSRERRTSRSARLLSLVERDRLGILVFCKGATLDVLLRITIRSSRRPFTFPEVSQLQELGLIIESSLARSHLSAKAQQAERLAAVGLLGASVAHEIRNPLVTIKTFVQLLPTHYADASFRGRFLKLIASEVGRIERLTEQLLDLASPRKFESREIQLHDVVDGCLGLVASKAEEKETEILTALNASPDTVFLDPNAVKQVLLNLCFNAIQAQEYIDRTKWIQIETKNLGSELELVVSDNGPGIAPEMRSRLFEAFQTTKSSGFGLGLAICSEILSEIGASIKVDPYVSGKGATFRVLFPCQPRSY